MRSVILACVGLLGLLLANAGLAGRIIIDPKVDTPVKEAERPVRARTDPHRVVGLPASAVITDVDDEAGFFPQHGDDSLLDEKARVSREGAKEQLQQGVVQPNNGVDTPDLNTQEGVAGNLSKARAYMKNSTSQRVAELPVVSCDNVNNVTGRIGDDSQSGSIITIMVNGKQVKARCK